MENGNIESGKCKECQGDLEPLDGEDKCECPKGFVPEDFKDSDNIKCRICPIGVENCLGDNIMEMSLGFWRSDV